MDRLFVFVLAFGKLIVICGLPACLVYRASVRRERAAAEQYERRQLEHEREQMRIGRRIRLEMAVDRPDIVVWQ